MAQRQPNPPGSIYGGFGTPEDTEDPCEGRYGPVETFKFVPGKVRLYTESSFTKRQILHVAEGGRTSWKWGQQRLTNEAFAWKLLTSETNIRVPRLLEYGVDKKGRGFVTMERVHGISLDQVFRECRMAPSNKHTENNDCLDCQALADENADNYITNEVIPQLHKLTSKETGLKGFVLPPPRIVEYDDRDDWPTKQTSHRIYSFVHGDLAKHNIIMDSDTLQVLCICDWEQAGYFPAEMEVEAWRMADDEYRALFVAEERILREISLITE